MVLNPEQIASLLGPYLLFEVVARNDLTVAELCERVAIYLELLSKWNARTNLTSIRTPEEIVRRHFGESFFAAGHLPAKAESVLDLGSGAGFPGVPIQLMWPDVRVTLAESQHKKVAFLREVIRVLGLPTEVWPRRVEELPLGASFDVVALRAVDRMENATMQASRLARLGIMVLGTGEYEVKGHAGLAEFAADKLIRVPESQKRVLRIFKRCQIVPRGT